MQGVINTMKIFITGICGFVGSRIASSLKSLSSEIEIIGIDNLSRRGSWINISYLEKQNIKVIHGDIRQSSDLESIDRCDWIIDAAANPTILAGILGTSNSRQVLENNLSGTIQLLELCKKWDAGFILLSTSRVYSIEPLSKLDVNVVNKAYMPLFNNLTNQIGISADGISELYPTLAPISLYGSTKLASEVIAAEYSNAFGIPVWINRCGVMAGAGQFGKADQGIFAYWLHSWAEGKPLRYIGFDGKGHQVRDCLHPHDLALLLMKQVNNPINSSKQKIVNVSGGSNSAFSLAQLSEWCEQRWRSHAIGSDSKSRPYDLPWVVLNSSECIKQWDWKPTKTVHSILEEISNFADQNPGWINLSA